MRSDILYRVIACASATSAALVPRQYEPQPASCPGYTAQDVTETAHGLTADLVLAGPACNLHGNDVDKLKLTVTYDSDTRLHVKIEDADEIAYQVPSTHLSISNSTTHACAEGAALAFSYQSSPFSFAVTRKSNDEVLFNSSASNLIFEDQYVRLRTSLPQDPNIYGLGEHSDHFRLNTTNYTRTLWSRDAYGIPSGTNLYGNHPIYFDHRGENGTHGVFLFSSAGMDIKINNTEAEGQYLEYNLLSGVLDLYFIAGPTPVEVSQQYSEIVGKSAMPPYWGFGFHQCRYGYRDFYAIAEVIANYSAAGIPLETMWTDIDYMEERLIMTTDPDRFPVPRMREIVDYLHAHDQHYIVMVDPAVAYKTERKDGSPYLTFNRGRDEELFLQKNGSIFQGVVWPGVTAFPDWFHPNTSQFWTEEFARFFSAEDGVDIDGLWIDMNEAANFNYFGDNPQDSAKERGFPPTRPQLRSSPRQISGFPAKFQPNSSSPYPPDSLSYAPPWLSPDAAPNTKRAESKRRSVSRNLLPRQALGMNDSDIIGYPNRNLLAPSYQINNENTMETYGGLSNFTLDTDIIHYDGHVELDVHNLYGSMMSNASRNAMEARRPGRRTLVVTRSTFAGDGKAVSKWLGDNLSTWDLYRQSIQGMLDFVALYQMPMVGSDVCGFGANTTETLCARWAMLGAFNPFYRNHNGDSSIPQEFYLWETVATAAKNAIDMRYRLLDYIYTALYVQSDNGKPLLSPMFFKYPNDTATFGVELQFFYGDSLLVSPVTEENSTSVDVYMPDDLFYDFNSYKAIRGNGTNVTLSDIDFTEIPLHVRAGSIIPLRNESAMTTTELRQKPFHFLIAPTEEGKAVGTLYLDDGDSLVQNSTSLITMKYKHNILYVDGGFGYYQHECSALARVTLLGVAQQPMSAPRVNCDAVSEDDWTYDSEKQRLELLINMPLKESFDIRF